MKKRTQRHANNSGYLHVLCGIGMAGSVGGTVLTAVKLAGSGGCNVLELLVYGYRT